MAIKQYSLAKDGARQLAPGFKVREFRCRDGSDVVMIDESLVMLLQCIREHFGKPIIDHQRVPHGHPQHRCGWCQNPASTCWAGRLTSRCRASASRTWLPTPRV